MTPFFIQHYEEGKVFKQGWLISVHMTLVVAITLTEALTHPLAACRKSSLIIRVNQSRTQEAERNNFQIFGVQKSVL